MRYARVHNLSVALIHRTLADLFDVTNTLPQAPQLATLVCGRMVAQRTAGHCAKTLITLPEENTCQKTEAFAALKAGPLPVVFTAGKRQTPYPTC